MKALPIRITGGFLGIVCLSEFVEPIKCRQLKEVLFSVSLKFVTRNNLSFFQRDLISITKI